MELGINGTGLVQKADAQAVIEHARQAHNDGFTNYWIAEHPTGGFDALTVLTAAGSALPELNVGTAIIPTMPRHPAVLAGQATTTNNILGGRLTLGIGAAGLAAALLTTAVLCIKFALQYSEGWVDTIVSFLF